MPRTRSGQTVYDNYQEWCVLPRKGRRTEANVPFGGVIQQNQGSAEYLCLCEACSKSQNNVLAFPAKDAEAKPLSLLGGGQPKTSFWHLQLDRLIQWIQDKGCLPRANMQDDKERSLYRWMVEQRRSKVLAPGQQVSLQKCLDDLTSQRLNADVEHTASDSKCMKWKEHMETVMSWARAQRRLPSAKSEDIIEKKLGHWFKNNLRYMSGLSSDQCKQVDDFRKDIHMLQFSEHVQHIISWMRAHDGQLPLRALCREGRDSAEGDRDRMSKTLKSWETRIMTGTMLRLEEEYLHQELTTWYRDVIAQKRIQHNAEAASGSFPVHEETAQYMQELSEDSLTLPDMENFEELPETLADRGVSGKSDMPDTRQRARKEWLDHHEEYPSLPEDVGEELLACLEHYLAACPTEVVDCEDMIVVGPEVFAFVTADDGVQRTLHKHSMFFSKNHRDWLRHILLTSYVDVVCRPAVLKESGIASLSVEGLLENAAGNYCENLSCTVMKPCSSPVCVHPTTAATSYLYLRRYFADRLRADTRFQQHGFADSWTCFEYKFHRNLENGVSKTVKVCCSDVLHRVKLRQRDGAVDLFRAPFLPANVDIALGGKLSEARRRTFYEHYAADKSGLAVTHGSVVIRLPSDYLCSKCQRTFMELTPEELSLSANEWWDKLHMDPSHRDSRSVVLANEQRRLLDRRSAMLEARNQNFEGFRELLGTPLFERQHVEQHVHKIQLEPPSPVMFHDWDVCWFGNSFADSQQWISTGLGVAKNTSGNLWSLPIPRLMDRNQKNINQFTFDVVDLEASFAFTGRPGFVKQDLWMLRAFTTAAGGFHCMSGPKRTQLLMAEGDHDPEYITNSSGVHVMKYCPIEFDKWLWLELCRDAPERAAGLRSAVMAERDAIGLFFRPDQSEPEVTAEKLLSYVWRTETTISVQMQSLQDEVHLHTFLQQRKHKQSTWPTCFSSKSRVNYLTEDEYRQTTSYWKLQDTAERLSQTIVLGMRRRRLSQWLAILRPFSADLDRVMAAEKHMVSLGLYPIASLADEMQALVDESES